MPLGLCVGASNSINASQATEYNVTGLLPYVVYQYKITVHSNAGSAVTPEIPVTTLAESKLASDVFS